MMAYSGEDCRQLENLIMHKQQLSISQTSQWELETLFSIRQNLFEIDKGVKTGTLPHVRWGQEQDDSKDAKTLKLLADSLELLADQLEQECSFKNKNRRKSKKKKRSTSASSRRNSVFALKPLFHTHKEYLNSQPENILGKATSELHMMRELSTRNDMIFNMALGIHGCELRPVLEKGRNLPSKRTQSKSTGLFPGTEYTEICYTPESWLYA